MSAIVSGLVGGIAAVVLVALAQRSRRAAPQDADGWRSLRPGWLIDMAIVLSAGLAALCFYVWLFVGSSRADAERQMMICLLLGTGFALGAAYAAWAGYARSIRWNADEIRVRTLGGTEVARRLSDVVAVASKDALSEYHVDFRDGSRLRLSTYFRGVDALLETLPVKASPS